MLVRKSKISSLIQKERQKERIIWEKKQKEELLKLKKIIEAKHTYQMKELEHQHRLLLLEKEREIKQLQREINRNYTTYQEIRRREKHLDDLTVEVENEVERMLLKVQESIQPFYRTRGKIDTIRRKSNRKDDKVESIFKAIK